jgi:hypothetical protein
MAAADKAERLRAGLPASLVQVYTAGLRWETEPMVTALAQVAASTTSLHRLPLACPLEEPPGDHHTLWTALWQAACLLLPDVSPARWRPRLRRLARIAGALLHVDTRADAPEQHEATEDPRTVLDARMAEWVRRLLLPLPRMTDSSRPTISVLESAELDLDAMELCRREGGVVLVAWQRVHPAKRGDGGWQWRVVAGLEGLENPTARGASANLGERIQPRSVLLLPQEAEAVWGCGYGMRLDPAASLDTTSPETSNHWQLRSLYGGWTAVEVVQVLMLRPSSR